MLNTTDGSQYFTVKLVIDGDALAAYEKEYFRLHPKAKKKPIAHPYHESINQWMILRRPSMNNLKQRWKDFIVFLVRSGELRDLHIEKCSMKCTTFYGMNRRHDVDNCVPKFILDGLCESGLLIDDDSTHLTSLTLECDVDKEYPRTEIEIYVSKLLTENTKTECKEERPMAKKKNSKVSVNSLDAIMKEIGNNTENVQWRGIDVTITKCLTLDDMLSFVSGVVQSCFNSETNAYLPEVKDFAVRKNALELYANFTLPSNVARQYEIVMRSGAYEMILEHIDTVQFESMMHAIDAKLQNLAEANVQMVFRQFSDVVQAFENLQAQISGTFDGVGAEDIAKLVDAIGENGFSEEKLVQAYKAIGKD